MPQADPHHGHEGEGEHGDPEPAAGLVAGGAE